MLFINRKFEEKTRPTDQQSAALVYYFRLFAGMCLDK